MVDLMPRPRLICVTKKKASENYLEPLQGCLKGLMLTELTIL